MDTPVIVATALGPLPESDLEFEMLEQESGPESWVYAHEGRYVGSDPGLSAHRGEIIRRDVWMIIKYGHAATGEQGG